MLPLLVKWYVWYFKCKVELFVVCFRGLGAPGGWEPSLAELPPPPQPPQPHLQLRPGRLTSSRAQ